MRLRFSSLVFIRSLIFFLVLLILALVAISFLPPSVLRTLINLWISRPPDPTPPPPTILAPHGTLPTEAVGLQEWVRFGSGDFRPMGSGFLMQLRDGTIVGVTTAHSVGDLGDPANTATTFSFQAFGREGYVAEFDTLYGPPGVPRTGDDMLVDWVLLKLNGEVDPGLVLDPDPRGGPQPGERVIVYSGRGDGVTLGGTVQSAESQAVWVLMDSTDYPGGMSGSPLISEHTGQVVGMAIATAPRADRYLMAFHPIGSLVAKAEAAREFPKIVEFQR
ncbi:MAG TPA: trypsin-like peptidase domain-containing protein [Anaerolineales bacterium]|nr:trypsin-like peptidase domain-containing protein [Anaerolineales bacterium]